MSRHPAARRRSTGLVAATVAAVVVLVLATGCAGDAGATGDSAASTTASTTASASSASKVPGADLVGRYAHYDVVAYESADMKTLIVSFGFTDLDVVDGKLVAQESFCHADHRSDQPITTTISDEATSAIQPVPATVDVTTVDGTTRLHRPETPTGVGIDLAHPADPLPTDPNDPRIVDDDGDGHPGITVHIVLNADVSGDLYLARRERFAYDLEANDDGSLTGTVEDHSEQLLIGASSDLFLTQAPWVQVADRSKSPIILRPVDRDWDCDRLMAARDDLFPPTPSVDW